MRHLAAALVISLDCIALAALRGNASVVAVHQLSTTEPFGDLFVNWPVVCGQARGSKAYNRETEWSPGPPLSDLVMVLFQV